MTSEKTTIAFKREFKLDKDAENPKSIPVEELEGLHLDLAVALAEGKKARIGHTQTKDKGLQPICIEQINTYGVRIYEPSTNHQLVGELIEKHRISVIEKGSMWRAFARIGTSTYVSTENEVRRLAILRLVVAMKYGDTFTLPA